MKQSETITFPCETCGSYTHAAQAHRYYPFNGQEWVPQRYLANIAPATYQPPGDVASMPLDADGKLRDARAMKPMAERVFVLRDHDAMGDAAHVLYERTSQMDWLMAKELDEDLALSIAMLLRNAGATFIDEREVQPEQQLVLPEGVTFEHLRFVDELHATGKLNMYGAHPYIRQELGVDTTTASLILATWMETFEQRHPR